MPRIKAEFHNDAGQPLAGLLELPEQPAEAFALFAHCFTCSKDVAAASRISRALSARGIGVLRFDFTGLGNSDGDFANTNFSSNVEDLLCAAKFLEREHRAPSLLVGHSLGGAAVLAAAQQLPSCKAVATIGAPSRAAHVTHLFRSEQSEISEEGSAEVELGGRRFKIKRQFVDDLGRWNDTAHLAKLDRALLIFHSPIDNIVSIDEAAEIYTAARHPKSFVSLDSADHLLSRREDSEYVADVIQAWAGRYLGMTDYRAEAPRGTAPTVAAGHVRVVEKNKAFTRLIYTEHHQLVGDEPKDAGGADLGPSPYELLLAALGLCTSMTVRMYANRKKLNLDAVTVELSHHKIDASECEDCETKEGMVDVIEKKIRLEGDLSDEVRARVLEIADRCPVNRTLSSEIKIRSV